ncbi:hypothetical protein C8J56DRAFT_898960 [Mycena floridula]|nr:hypothetical protein C8J56DRAFT_898960 [Mycena floridula]
MPLSLAQLDQKLKPAISSKATSVSVPSVQNPDDLEFDSWIWVEEVPIIKPTSSANGMVAWESKRTLEFLQLAAFPSRTSRENNLAETLLAVANLRSGIFECLSSSAGHSLPPESYSKHALSILITLILVSFTIVSAAPVQAGSASGGSRKAPDAVTNQRKHVSDRKKLAPLKSQHAAILTEEKEGSPTTQTKLPWNKHRKMLVDLDDKVDLQTVCNYEYSEC